MKWRNVIIAALLAAFVGYHTLPASATLFTWDQNAADNATADNTVNWSEGQSPGSVNNSARAMMAAIAKWRDDMAGVKPSNAQIEVGGTASAYTLSTNQSLTSLTNGFTVTFKVGTGLTNVEGVTLAVDGLAAKNISSVAGENLEAGVLVAGSLYTVSYHQPDDEWILHGFYTGSSDATPAGVIQDYAGDTAPDGYLLPAGQAVSRTTYDDLFAAIGTTYGAGDESTTFNLPDLRGRVVAGKDDMNGSAANRLTSGSAAGVDGATLGAADGEEEVTLTESQMPAHDHDFNDPGHTHTYDANIDSTITVSTETGGNTDQAREAGANTRGVNSNTTGITVNSQGGGEAHANVQPTMVMNKIIKF